MTDKIKHIEDKPEWFHWQGRDGIHGFPGKSDRQITEETKKWRENLKKEGR